MNITVFWEKTADTFKTQPEVFRARSAASLRSRWSVLQRVVQKYLSADKQYRSSIPSGEVEEDTVACVMKLYCGTIQVANKFGEKVDAPVFRSVEVALPLADFLKFSPIIGWPSSTNLGYRPVSMEAGGGGGTAGGDGARAVEHVDREEIEKNNSDDQGAGATLAAAVPMQSPNKGRPMGTKRQKGLNDTEYKSVRGISAIAKYVDGVKRVLASSSENKTKMAGLSLEAKLVELMAEGPAQQRAVHELMLETKTLRAQSAARGGGEDACVGVHAGARAGAGAGAGVGEPTGAGAGTVAGMGAGVGLGAGAGTGLLADGSLDEDVA